MSFSHIITLCTIAQLFVCYYLWNPRLFFRRALQVLRDKNIIFTKIFQSLANNNRVTISTMLREEFRRYAADVPYTDDEINYESIDDIERDYDVNIDRRVTNSGMIALVFNGTRLGSEPIILKLKRNNIDARLKTSCDEVVAMHRLAMYWWPNNIILRILTPFIANIDDIIDQCNFGREIANMKIAKEEFAPLDYIHIPTVYNVDPSSSHDFILMEKLEGSHILNPDTPEEVRLDIMEKFSTFTSYGFLYNTTQHTDLHHGNIIFMPDGGLGIIDYGMAIQPTDAVHEIILSIAAVIKTNPPIHEVDFIETFKELFVPPLVREEIRDVAAVEDICISIAQPMIDNIDFDELNFTDSLERLTSHLGHDVVLNRGIYKLILGFTMMGAKHAIMGDNYLYPNKLIAIERRALNKAFAMIM